MSEYLVNRRGTWHYQRRVPIDYASFDKRGIVRLTTKVKVANDRTGKIAARICERINGDLEAFWRGHAEGRASEAVIDFAAARARARALGLDYKSTSDIAQLPTPELIERLRVLMPAERRGDAQTAAAVLGAVQPPVIMLSSLYDEFLAAVRAEIADMSEEQARKFKAAKKRAVEILISVVGDVDLPTLKRDKAIAYVDWWSERVVSDGIKIGTANKNISHIAGMLRRVIKRHGLPADAQVFAGLRLEGNDDGQRPPFPRDFIRDRLLAAGAMARMNAEARAVVLIMINTGARPSEIINLSAARIRLEANIPHIQIRPDGRRLKTDLSARDLPLAGASLEAMREFKEGFPRYRGKGASLSAAVNKFLSENDLLPTSEHSLYSLRHSFKDRLRNSEAPGELIDELMGHSNDKPSYGEGYDLVVKQKWIQAIAL